MVRNYTNQEAWAKIDVRSRAERISFSTAIRAASNQDYGLTDSRSRRPRLAAEIVKTSTGVHGRQNVLPLDNGSETRRSIFVRTQFIS